MNKRLKGISLAIILASNLCGNADEPVKISEFKHKITGVSYDENFNSGAGCWTLSKSSEIRKGEGITGSDTLFVNSPEGEKGIDRAAYRPIKVIPGNIYNISIKYRTENVKQKNEKRSSFILGYVQPYDKNGKKLKSQNFWIKDNLEKDWQEFSNSVTIPNEAVEDAELVLVFDWWHTGKIWFDDITLEPSGIAATIFPLEPSNLALEEDGSIALRAYFHDKNKALQELAMLVTLNGKSKLLYPSDGVYRGKFGSFSGEVKVAAKLLDLKNKTIIAEHNYLLFRQTGDSPAGATKLDKFGRTLCNGKPILPIGVFTYQTMHENDLARVKDNGFDCIFFGCRAKNLLGKNSNSKEEMTNMLNGLEKYNLKAMLQLTLMIPAKEATRKKFEPEFDGIKDSKQMIAALVKSIKNHPSFLGYYLADENQRDDLKQVQELREAVSKIDPYHITVSLTDRPDNFPFFVPTGDVLCHDNYPLPDAKNVSVSDKNLAYLAQMKTPFWFCAQAFLWRTTSKEQKNDSDPTEGAVRAVPLLSVIHGAKGFIFYSYHEVFAKGSKIDPKLPDEFWPKVVSAVKMLRELEPFILSTVTDPALNIKALNGTVRSRAMAAEDGRIAISLVSISTGKNSITITPPSGKKYVSRYGLSSEQADGSWVFTANDIDCDILYSK